MFLDAMLLGHSDILIAARRSAFTQILPRALIFAPPVTKQKATTTMKKNRPQQYCEVLEEATSMTCFHDSYAWLFRSEPPPFHHSSRNNNTTINDLIKTYSIPRFISSSMTTTNNSTTTGTIMMQKDNTSPVIHKAIVHLPNVQLKKKQAMEHAHWFFSSNNTQVDRMMWGPSNINNKYRKLFQDRIMEWTFA